MISMLKVRIRICVEPDGDGFYAYCPELGGVHEDGSTVEEAVSNAKESALVIIDSILRHNDPLPLCIERYDLSFSALWKKIKSKIFLQNKMEVRIEELSVSLAT